MNSEKLEFGLLGSATFATLDGLDDADYLRKFNLGLYFNVKLKDKLFLHTGFAPKTTLGAKGLSSFPTGDAALDTLLDGGMLQVEFNQISLPVLFAYQTTNWWGAEIGPQISIRTKVNNVIENEIGGDNELTNRQRITDSFNMLNFEAVGGIYKKLKDGEGMTISLRYAHGLNDLVNDNKGDALKHQAFYTIIGIPIGKEKASSLPEG